MDALAKRKQKQVRGVLIHSLLYVFPFVPCMVLLGVSPLQTGSLLFSLGFSHFLVDLVSRKYCTFTSFLVDQVIHLAVLLVMAILFPFHIQLPASVVGIGFALLLIFKPSSVIVSRVLSSLALPEPSEKQDTVHAGHKIGYLERLIILLVCLFGAISTCALVIAAKTLVRYAGFSDDSAFREVFLVGTLTAVEQEKKGMKRVFHCTSILYTCT